MQETKMFDKNGEPARSLETTTQPVPDCSFEMQPPGSDSGPAEHSCNRPRAKALLGSQQHDPIMNLQLRIVWSQKNRGRRRNLQSVRDHLINHDWGWL